MHFEAEPSQQFFLRVKDLHEAAMPLSLSLALWKLVVRHLFFVALSASDLRAGIFSPPAAPWLHFCQHVYAASSEEAGTLASARPPAHKRRCELPATCMMMCSRISACTKFFSEGRERGGPTTCLWRPPWRGGREKGADDCGNRPGRAGREGEVGSSR